jgi:hypothetical protein
MALIDAKLLAELRQKHPDAELHRLGGTTELVVVKTPSAEAWDAMQDRVLDPKTTSAGKRAAAHNLLVSCLVHPDRGSFTALLDKRPGLLQTFANQLSGIAGVDNDAVPEKLDA